MKRLANVGLSILLTGLVAVAIVAVIIPALTGTRAVHIDRTSMQRAIPFGSLAYIKNQATYQVGDIITFPWNGSLVSHEVVAIYPNPTNAALDGTWLVTKGTENAEPDANPVETERVLGKVLFHAPFAGLALKTIGTPVVDAFLAILALGLYLITRTGRSNTMTLEHDMNETKVENEDRQSLIDGDAELRDEAKAGMTTKDDAKDDAPDLDVDEQQPEPALT